jgi:hypothetical protein
MAPSNKFGSSNGVKKSELIDSQIRGKGPRSITPHVAGFNVNKAGAYRKWRQGPENQNAS